MTIISNIGMSALNAAQAAIEMTGQNIANASTEGYTRQEILQTSNAGTYNGYGYIGNGTSIVGIERVYDEFLSTQANSTTTDLGTLSTYLSQIEQLDSLFANSEVGVNAGMEAFFESVQSLTSDPTSLATRELVLTSAEALTSLFQSTDEALTNINEGVNTQINSSIEVVNAMAEQIAILNNAINTSAGSNNGVVPNELYDQRDLVVNELSEYVQLSVVEEGNSFNIYVGSGQPLVIGNNVNNLVAEQSPEDASKINVAFQNGGTTMVLNEESLVGGSLAGLLQFRTETLEEVSASMDLLATSFAMTFNDQHVLGQDLNGDLGNNFFDIPAPSVTAHVDNSFIDPSSSVSATIVDVSALTTSDYLLTITDDSPLSYQFERLSDGEVIADPATVGLELDVTGSFSVGDQFTIRPIEDVAATISVALTSANEIAAAAPVATAALNTNMGTGEISAGVVNDVDNANLLEEITITFTSDTTYTVSGTGTGNPSGLTYVSGEEISYNGWSLEITGIPKAGDSFAVSANVDGVGDARNASLLSDLQSENILNGGTATYQDTYSKMVSIVSSKTYELNITTAAATSAYEDAYDSQQSVSGVNLDEEAAKLIQYQNAYEAAAKMMSMESELFDTLMSIFN